MSTETSNRVINPSIGCPCWIQIPAIDTSRAQEFYKSLFGWTFTQFTPEMFGFTLPGEKFKELGGAILKVPEIPHNPGINATVIYFWVANVDEALEKVEKAGGSIVKGKSAEQTDGWMADFKDTEGNVHGVYCYQ